MLSCELVCVPYNDFPRDRLVEPGRANLPAAIAGRRAKPAEGRVEVLRIVAKSPSRQAAIKNVLKKYRLTESGANSRIYRAQHWLKNQRPDKTA